MGAVKTAVAFTLFINFIWTIFWLLYLGLDSWQMNRRIKDADHPSPDELRNRAILIAQLALMGLVNVTAGAIAGIGSPLFVDGGRFRWPSSQTPYTFFIIAASLTVFTGIIIGNYISRPTREWVWDTSDFRSYLRQVAHEGLASETDLAEILRRRKKWDERTNVSPLHSPDELTKLRLDLPRAHREWISSELNDPVEFGTQLRADTSVKQVWRWLWRKRLWKLGVPSLIAGISIALIIISKLNPELSSLSVLLPWILLIVITPFCVTLVYFFAFRVARLDLIMTNRYLALERKQLRDCDHLIKKIKELSRQKEECKSPSGAGGKTGTLVFRLGRWDVHRREARIQGYPDRDRRRTLN